MNIREHLEAEIAKRDYALTRPGNSAALNGALEADLAQLHTQLADLNQPADANDSRTDVQTKDGQAGTLSIF